MIASVQLIPSPAAIPHSNAVNSAEGLAASEEAHRHGAEDQSKPTAANHGFAPPSLSKDAVTALQETSESENETQLGLTDEEVAIVKNLKARDREVRNHEQAHAAVGGQYAGSPTYTYQNGPDNQRYAIGGEVKIDANPIAGDPKATIQKMETVIRAALAPAEPSAQDRKVAAAASAHKLDAQIELNAIRDAERKGEAEPGSSDTPEQGAPSPEAAPIINLFA